MKALTIGSATIDHYIFTKPEIVWKKREELIAYPLGSKIHIKKTLITTGGGGSNTATTFSLLGFKTSYAGVIGIDPYGEIVEKELKKRGIKHIGEKKGENAYSIILDAVGHDRTIFVYKGSTNELREIKLNKYYNIFYMSNTLGKTLRTTQRIVKNIDADIKAFNPSEYMIKEERRAVINIAKNSNIVVMNKEEAQLLTQGREIQELLKKLKKLIGEKIIVVTDGPRGAMSYWNNNYYYIKARKIRVIDSTGAGDAFASTLTAMITQGFTLKESMKIAIINAEQVIQKIGAKEGLLTQEELMEKVSKDKRKVKQL